jgi:hypothetical protein
MARNIINKLLQRQTKVRELPAIDLKITGLLNETKLKTPKKIAK